VQRKKANLGGAVVLFVDFVVVVVVFFTCAIRIIALPAFCPVTPTLGSPVGGRGALAGPLLRAVGTGHRAIAPSAPLLPLSVH